MTDGVSIGSRDDPTDERNASAPCHVLGLVADPEVRSRIDDALPGRVLATMRPPGDGDPRAIRNADVLLVDEATVRRQRDRIADQGRDRRGPWVVLVTDDRSAVDPDVWDDVDDVLPADAERPALRSRLDTVIAAGCNTGPDPLGRVLPRTTDSVVAADVDREHLVVREINEAFERTFGIAADEAVGSPLHELVVPEDAYRRAAGLVDRLRSGETVETTVRRTTRSGRRDFRLRMVPAERAAPVDAYVIYSDVTEKRCRKQQVEVLNRVLRHNLRNELNVILGNAEQLVDAVEDPGLAEAGRSIRRTASNLVELGETARVLESIWEPRGEETIDAVEAVDRVCGSVRDAYPDATVRVDAPSGARVVADRRIESAVYELCENAIEQSGGPDPEIRIAVAPDEDWTELRIEDRGPGLPATERAVLRGDDETPLRHGSGIGLWIVYWTVTALGGEVDVADNDPRGTAVTITLRTARSRTVDAE